MPHKEESKEFVPDLYPPFPEGSAFPTADLQTISLKKLESRDEAEENRAFVAFKGKGFVYLDLADSVAGETILHGSVTLCEVAERFFTLTPLEEKTKFMPKNKELFGYKTKGATITNPKTGERDTAEFFNVSKNDSIVSDDQMQRAWPQVILESKPLFDKYCRASHSTGLMIVHMLAAKLGISKHEIDDRHVFEEHAGDHVRLTRGPPRASAEMPEIQTPSHTDFGTITILINWLGGLQVWSESSRKLGALEPDVPGEWLFVKPKPGCAIVNLGDAAVKFTNGVLCSGRHRVIPAPGEQGKWPRYSVVYFVRPTDHCRLKTLKGHGIPPADDMDEEGVQAKEWIYKQAMQLGWDKLD